MRSSHRSLAALLVLAACRSPAPDHGAEMPTRVNTERPAISKNDGGPPTSPKPAVPVASAPTPDAPTPDEPEVAGAIPREPPGGAVGRDAAHDHAFSAKLYGALARPNGQNLFFSPASIRFALGMAFAGAEGATSAEMKRVLEYDASSLDVAGYVLAKWAARSARKAEPGAPPADVLRVVNRVWVRTGLSVLPAYRATLDEKFRAPLSELDFPGHAEESRKTINEWVEKETRNKIKDLIPAGSIDASTASVLTNAVYFKAAWREAFPDGATTDGPFEGATSPAKYMTRTGEYPIGKVPGASVLELPYAGGTQSMLVVLPDAPTGLSSLEHSLGAGSIDAFTKSLKEAHVRVTFPRFSVTSTFSLAEPLGALGMKQAFSPKQADFSGIDGKRDLFVSEAIHRAVVDVDEHGTEAAAATALVMRATSIRREKTVEFRVDHPFLFVIRDVELGYVLFMGRVTNPTSPSTP